MVRLNRTQLPQNQMNALYKRLDATIGKCSAKESALLLGDLLGKEERIMLAKRLAAIILIIEGYSLYRTSRLLKISPTTAEKLKQGIEKGTYARLMKVIGKNKHEYHSILETLDSILHLGGMLPHYNGLDRYKFLR